MGFYHIERKVFVTKNTKVHYNAAGHRSSVLGKIMRLAFRDCFFPKIINVPSLAPYPCTETLMDFYKGSDITVGPLAPVTY